MQSFKIITDITTNTSLIEILCPGSKMLYVIVITLFFLTLTTENQYNAHLLVLPLFSGTTSPPPSFGASHHSGHRHLSYNQSISIAYTPGHSDWVRHEHMTRLTKFELFQGILHFRARTEERPWSQKERNQRKLAAIILVSWTA